MLEPGKSQIRIVVKFMNYKAIQKLLCTVCILITLISLLSIKECHDELSRECDIPSKGKMGIKEGKSPTGDDAVSA